VEGYVLFIEAVEDDGGEDDGSFEEAGVEVELLAVGFIEDQPNLDQQYDEVLGGEELSDAQSALLYYSPGLQLADHAEVYDSQELHDADDDDEVAFAGDGQGERAADFLH
jgi:hypothetical protein